MLRRTILIFSIILLSVSACTSQAKAESNLVAGVNYLDNGNDWNAPRSQYTEDFTRFSQDGIKYLSVRIMWKVMTADGYSTSYSGGQLSTSALTGVKTLLEEANSAGIKVCLDFWSQFGYDLGLPEWVSPQSYWTVVRDDTTLSRYESYVEKVVTELKDYPALEAWTIFNEPWFDQSSDKGYFVSAFTRLVSAIKDIDQNNMVTCRITLDHVPPAGGSHYDDNLYDIFDIFAVTMYLDPRDPADVRYNAHWSYWEDLISDLQARGKHLWIIEYGTKVEDTNSGPKWGDEEDARERMELMLQKAEATGIVDRLYGWDWQTTGTSTNDFNFYDTATHQPDPCYYELMDYPGYDSSTPSPTEPPPRYDEPLKPVDIPDYSVPSTPEPSQPGLQLDQQGFLLVTCVAILALLHYRKTGSFV